MSSSSFFVLDNILNCLRFENATSWSVNEVFGVRSTEQRHFSKSLLFSHTGLKWHKEKWWKLFTCMCLFSHHRSWKRFYINFNVREMFVFALLWMCVCVCVSVRQVMSVEVSHGRWTLQTVPLLQPLLSDGTAADWQRLKVRLRSSAPRFTSSHKYSLNRALRCQNISAHQQVWLTSERTASLESHKCQTRSRRVNNSYAFTVRLSVPVFFLFEKNVAHWCKTT